LVAEFRPSMADASGIRDWQLRFRSAVRSGDAGEREDQVRHLLLS
jgi:hypothetical protein